MNKLKRFHKDVFYPEWSDNSIDEFTKPLDGNPLILSYHANRDKYRYLPRRYKRIIRNILETVKLNNYKDTIFEFYSDGNNRIKKACFRFPTDVESDIIMVISSTGKVVTIFLNRNFDPKISLDRNLYEQGENRNVVSI